jgi:AhpD family alkylhydroperoxidase
MLGVTSVNQCAACARVHERWAQGVGLPADPLGFEPAEAAAYAYGQGLAALGPRMASPPHTLPARHRRELEAAALLMELANLAGNRFLSSPRSSRRARSRPQLHAPAIASAYDLVMGAADRAGVRRIRQRVAGDTRGTVLELGIGTGLNIAAYPPGVALHAVDPSGPALQTASRRADRLGREVTLVEGGAEALPYPDGSFDAIVGTFVLCSVDDVEATLRESRRVLRPGGTLRFVEHGRSGNRALARAQTLLAPAWARATGGCRLDHDVRAALQVSVLRIVNDRSRAGGLLVEVVAAPA